MPNRKATEMGVFVALLRSLRAWSQAELAAAAKVNERMISRYELGQETPREATLGRLARAVGIPLPLAKQVLPFIRRALTTVKGGESLPAARLATAGLGEDLAGVIESLAVEIHQKLVPPAEGVAELSPEDARREAAELWDSLKDRPLRDWRVLVEGARELRSWALAEKLCEESEKAAAADSARAVDLATFALRVAESAPAAEPQRRRLQGYVSFFLSNARRVAGDLPGASEAFGQAQRLWTADDSGLPLREWRVLDREASLRREQRRWIEALRLHDRALAAAPSENRSRILVNKAMTLEQRGHHEEAIAILRQAEPDIDAQREPRLAFALQANLALNLARLGRFAEADPILTEARRLADQLGNGLDLIRLRWIEGLTAAGLGRRAEAIAALDQVREEFLSRNIAYDATLATLELAVLYLEEGRTAEVKTLAGQMAPLFQAQGVERETLAAVKLFHEAVEKEEVTAELARRLVAGLLRAHRDPEP
jgi:transcriptional regulator with XRE-family HTH domain